MQTAPDLEQLLTNAFILSFTHVLDGGLKDSAFDSLCLTLLFNASAVTTSAQAEIIYLFHNLVYYKSLAPRFHGSKFGARLFFESSKERPVAIEITIEVGR